jgi:hypothetical protein|tara:strand:+ start:599 stop:805 length:207 start_codon:yes stop_codon:yes gene_type:complete
MDDNKILLQMICIYNALNDGWTVRKTGPNRYECEKELKKISSDAFMDEFVKEFLKYIVSKETAFSKKD